MTCEVGSWSFPVATPSIFDVGKMPRLRGTDDRGPERTRGAPGSPQREMSSRILSRIDARQRASRGLDRPVLSRVVAEPDKGDPQRLRDANPSEQAVDGRSAYVSLRWSELVAVERDDTDIEARTLRIDEKVVEVRGPSGENRRGRSRRTASTCRRWRSSRSPGHLVHFPPLRDAATIGRRSRLLTGTDEDRSAGCLPTGLGSGVSSGWDREHPARVAPSYGSESRLRSSKEDSSAPVTLSIECGR